MKNFKQKALEEFLNDEVQMINPTLYIWRAKPYQVLTLKQIYKFKSKPDHFIRIVKGLKAVYFRTLSEELTEKYYGNVLEML